MKYFAKLDAENVVVDVKAVADDSIDTDEKGKNFLNNLLGTDDNWIQTFKDGAQRAHMAFIEGKYLPEHDVFIDVCWFPSWTLNEETWIWEAPKPMPEPRENREIYWSEETTSWVYRKTGPEDFDDE